MCSTDQKRDPKVYRTASGTNLKVSHYSVTASSGMKAKDRIKVLTAFLKKCPEQYTM